MADAADFDRQMAAQNLQLGLQGFDISDHGFVRRCTLRAAGAEPAQSAAERHMDVKRYGRPRRDGLNPACEKCRIDRVVEMRCRRIAGVARHARVE